MKESRPRSTSPTADTSTDKTVEDTIAFGRNVDPSIIRNNPKIDTELISDFYRLVEASGGMIQGGRGANYGLSHPFGSNEVPTHRINKNQRKTKKR